MVSLLQFVFLGLRLDGVTSWNWAVSHYYSSMIIMHYYSGSICSILACVHCILHWRNYLHDNSNTV